LSVFEQEPEVELLATDNVLTTQSSKPGHLTQHTDIPTTKLLGQALQKWYISC